MVKYFNSNESRNACTWGVSKAFAVKVTRTFLSNRPCEKLKKVTGRASNKNKVYCSSRKIIFFFTTPEQLPPFYSICVLGKN